MYVAPDNGVSSFGTIHILQVLVGGHRAALRRGEDYPELQDQVPQQGVLVGVPLFHVTGLTSFSVKL
jgi:hypothetical protein